MIVDEVCKVLIMLILAYFVGEALFALHDERAKSAVYAAAIAACANGKAISVGGQVVRCRRVK